MRKLRIFEHVSLDGVIQNTPEDGFAHADWTAPYRSPAGRDAVASMQGDRFDLLLGRRTYDLWAGYWPQAPKGPIADPINAATKYVVTHRPESLGWGPCACVGPDFVEGVRRLKAAAGPDVVLWGSSTLTSALLRNGLADEIHLIVYPVLLGSGKRFFEAGASAPPLRTSGVKALDSGLTILSYANVRG